MSGNLPLLPYKSLNVNRVPLVSPEGDFSPSLRLHVCCIRMHKKQQLPERLLDFIL